MGTFTYKAAKIISNNLKPLCQNIYSISKTQRFPYMLPIFLPLLDDKEDVSNDLESLFTTIPIEDTIKYIIEQNVYT